MKKRVSFVLFAVLMFALMSSALADGPFGWLKDAWDWTTNAAEDAWEWTENAAGDAWDWTTGAAADAWDWTTGAATDAWDWTTGAATDAWKWSSDAVNSAGGWISGTATGAWGGVDGFFNPPSTEGNPNIIPEPQLPEGMLKMYLGYKVQKTGLDNGFSNELEIGKGDPHLGLTVGKFYVSGFSRAISNDDEHFIFLKNVGDNVELHFELVQDIDMLGGDTFVTINFDDNAYDKEMGVTPTNFGRGALIVKFTDYQNNPSEPQIYTDYLSAKQSGSADTVISLNEEGDYEVSLDYEINEKNYVLGTAITRQNNTDYKVKFKFSVRNGNCMIFPFDLLTGEELRNTAIAENGFRLDLAYSRYLQMSVQYSVLTEGPNGVVEDIRYNRPAKDGETYSQEGIYTIFAHNQYTGLNTMKKLYVGKDEKMLLYIRQGYTINQIIDEQNGR